MTAPTAAPHVQVWTDHLGYVHERRSDQHGRTLCGLNAGTSNTVLPARACRDCITAHLAAEDP